MKLILVALGSACGGVVRYLLTMAWAARTGFPYGTLCVNLLGSLAIGVLSGWLARGSAHAESIRAFAVVGCCGGFTTFSTFSNEMFRLLEAGRYGCFAAYVTLSLAGGLAAVCAGYLLSR